VTMNGGAIFPVTSRYTYIWLWMRE